MYRLVRPLLFSADPERVHHVTLAALERASGSPSALAVLERTFGVNDRRLELRRFGLHFPNPLGLAAGMDKDGTAIPAWRALGFGFVEVGSVTALAQPGNPRPRLFRVPEAGAIINRMGFNNRGAGALAARLAALPPARRSGFPVFVNVGKSRVVPLDEAAADYHASLELVWPHADGVVLNVSSPNTPGLRSLQEPEALHELLSVSDRLQAERSLPVLLKLAPDLSDEQLSVVASLAGEHEVAGLVAVNTTVSRTGLSGATHEEGGLSGRPLAARALEVLKLLGRSTHLPLVSVGGVFEADDLIARLRAGASLVEIYTGFVYGGPGAVGRMLGGLVRHLDEEGLGGVEELIGRDSAAAL